MLTPTEKWKAAAKAGTANPVLLFELRPTVLYDEKCLPGDWAGGAVAGGSGKYQDQKSLDTAHPTGELRLARCEIEHPDNQTDQSGDRKLFSFYEYIPTEGYNLRGQKTILTNVMYMQQYVQLVKFGSAFRLQKLCLGLYNRGNNYKGRTKVTLLSNVRETDRSISAYYRSGSRERKFTGRIDEILSAAETLLEVQIDHSKDGDMVEGQHYESAGGRYWRIIDLSDRNVWLPGGHLPCALTVLPEILTNVGDLQLLGSQDSGAYPQGDLVRVSLKDGVYERVPADLAFRFVADGYQASGSGIWSFDMSQNPGQGLSGDLELRYCEPSDSKLTFYKREGDTPQQAASGTWTQARDGSPAAKRFVQVKAVFQAGIGCLETPRIFSMRVASKRCDRFLLASRPLFGYPNLVAEAPDYSAEGEPLSGEATSTDTSRIVMLDPGGMVSRLFSDYSLKNDEIVVRLGFDVPGFTLDDYLPFKTVWIEDWQPVPGRVVVHGYDQQVRFKQAEAPAVNGSDPSLTEQIHYDMLNPALIKRDLISRAGIRPSRIEGASFAALQSGFDWQLVHRITKPTRLQSVCRELNLHLCGFEVVDENGRWVTPYVNFSASPVASISGNDILSGSEAYWPGRKDLRNYVAVLFGGQGGDERDYAGIALDYDEESEKANKESACDKLLSEFIPGGADNGLAGGAPLEIARRRLILQKDGVRVIEFATRLEFAWLQIGDHLNVVSTLYTRPGACDPNPLLVMLTRKNIDRNLGSINWTGLVLLDRGQGADPAPEVAPPGSLQIVPGGDGTVAWTWDKSPDDNGSDIVRYDLLARKSHLETWGTPKTSVTADGSASYQYQDCEFSELVAYDFGARAVHKNGRLSSVVTRENLLVTAEALGPPGADDWETVPVTGGIEIRVLNEVPGAFAYAVYVRADSLSEWTLVGRIMPLTPRKDAFVWYPDDPYGLSLVRFTLATVNKWGQAGEKSSQKSAFQKRKMKQSVVLSSAGFDSEGGTYPLISKLQIGDYYAFTVTLRIAAPAGNEDLVARYEVERSDDGGSGQLSWSPWERLPDCIIKQADGDLPAPDSVLYRNTDRMLKPGWYYRYRVRAVGLNNLPGDWSDPLILLLTEDSTAPDQPSFTVTALPLGFLLEIDAPTQSGQQCDDFAFFQIEGKKNGGNWQTLAGRFDGVVYLHKLTAAAADETWQFRVTAYDTSGNSSPASQESAGKSIEKIDTDVLHDGAVTETKIEDDSISTPKLKANAVTADVIAANAVTAAKIAALTITGDKIAASTLTGAKIAGGTITGDKIAANTIDVNKLNFTPVYDGNVIATINASQEGIRIDAPKLSISGSCEFASGYDPSSKASEDYVDNSVAPKLDKTGGQYNSAASGARVRIFPDSNTGLQIIDDDGSDVLKALVGGTDVGDVIIGSPAGQHLKWDKSESNLELEGVLTVNGLKTSASGANRVEIGTFDSIEQIRMLSGGENGLIIKNIGGAASIWMGLGEHQLILDGHLIWMQGVGTHSIIRMGQYLSDDAGFLAVYDQNNYYFTVFPSGINTTTTYQVNGNQVVGARGAAVADADGTLADITSKFNTLLSRLRAGTGHGLIAAS